MNRQTSLGLWCERLIEACWLFALTLIPIYFNLFSARHFEPDKANALRSLVLVMATAGIIRMLEQLNSAGQPALATAEGSPRPPQPSLWQRFNSVPMALPTVTFVLIFVLATITSVVPLTSFWGSYQRGQGTYTNLSYIAFALMMVVTLRRREQLERVVTMTILTGLAVAGYGVLQHFQLDPLPWRGDVISRVASTMGNSIFVAAYMIMVVPLALYRLISTLSEVQAAPTANVRVDLGWAVARSLLVIAGLAMIFSVIKFGAAVRTVDFRYWWFFPGVVAVVTCLWWLLTVDIERPDRRAPLWPGFGLIGFLLFFALFFIVSNASGAQIAQADLPTASDWWLWILLALFAVVGFYGLSYSLPRRGGAPSRLTRGLEAGGALISTAIMLLAVFYTQSRGPWIGIGAGLFVFITLILIEGERRTRMTDAARPVSLARNILEIAGALVFSSGLVYLAALLWNIVTGSRDRLRPGFLRNLLIGWIVQAVVLTGFLVIFNTSDAPFFKQLRDVPYIGRMGRLLEVDSGTGKVRVLIWFGDEHAGGATGLITSDPLRTIIGWGPESMFVAYNPFYPPSLAGIEARGASPDRSHQAWLDELITKGVLGLASYFFVLGSFFWMAWRFMRRSNDWRLQVFFIACISSVVCHAVEVLVGIPITSTLMMLWAIMALTILGGHIAGLVQIGRMAQEVVPEPLPEVIEAGQPRKPAARQPVSRRGGVARGVARSRSAGPLTRPSQGGSAALAAYGLIGALAFGAIWWFNLNPVYADMRFQEGQALSDRAGSGVNGLVQGMDDYLATIRSNPREDFYYLNLGRILMSIADTVRAQGGAIGEPEPAARVEELLRLEDVGAVQSFVQNKRPIELMSYAEAVLTRAHELNQLNKDHYANLGRLNNFWYSWTQDPERLRTSLRWYEQVTVVAPQDVSLINERAGIIMTMAEYLNSVGNGSEAESYYQQAQQLLDRSQTLDARYIDTDIRLGDLLRAQGRLDEAVTRYVAVIGRSPQQLNGQIERIAADLNEQPVLIRTLRDAYTAQAKKGDEDITLGKPGAASERTALLYAISGLLSVRANDLEPAASAYERAALLAPNSYDYRRNYTIVLSDTQRYPQAIAEAQATLALIEGQQGREREAAQIKALIAFLQARVGQ